MSVSIFVDLQGFFVGRQFIVKEFAALKDGFALSYYIFGWYEPWSNLIKAEKHQAMELIENHHGIQWKDEMVPYRSLITKVVMGATMMIKLSYTSRKMRNENGCEFCSWMKREIYVENIETHYENIKSLNKLDVTHILRCQKHVKNCALQNVFKLFKW